ncbi:hypothetical protein P4S73_25000 [Paraglaciecola sp. Hal342]
MKCLHGSQRNRYGIIGVTIKNIFLNFIFPFACKYNSTFLLCSKYGYGFATLILATLIKPNDWAKAFGYFVFFSGITLFFSLEQPKPFSISAMCIRANWHGKSL